jgi:hypothetical protein
MIDTAKAKNLRDRALRLVRSEGRPTYFFGARGR